MIRIFLQFVPEKYKYGLRHWIVMASVDLKRLEFNCRWIILKDFNVTT